MKKNKLNFEKLTDSRVLATRTKEENGTPTTKLLGATSEVMVVFEFPDYSVAEHKFLAGQTVEVLKAFLESEFDIEMSHLTLKRSDDCKVLLDPLSLVDYMEGECSSTGRYSKQHFLRVDVEVDSSSDWLQGESKHK